MLERTNYSELYKEIEEKIVAARIKAGASLNNVMTNLYYSIGETINKRQQSEGWGKSIIKKLALDLKKNFNGKEGYSESNLEYMRKFYLEYVRKKELLKLARQIPWSHNILILQKIKNDDERKFYLKATSAYGWSRNVLLNQVKSNAYKRTSLDLKNHNFKKTLPIHLLEQAEETLKSSYNLEFLNITEPILERELENKMIANIKEVLLELGYGFSFIGNQYKIDLSGKEYFIDLLFFHRGLQCLIAIELKAGEFKPEYAGKMNFYLEVLDEKIKMQHENPSIGIILCAQKDNLEVEYALRSSTRAIGVAEYKTTSKLPKKLAGQLPTALELKKRFKK